MKRNSSEISIPKCCTSRKEKGGPDSGFSWVIAAACCFINMMMYGMVRLSGVMFVASVERFGVNRQQASFPYSLSSTVRNIVGPLVGFLGQKFGVRAVTVCGGLVGAFGIGMCFLANTIFWVTICWGVIYGLGFGLGNILLPIAINQYFDKHRASASGISFSGACLGSFLMPSLVEDLLSIYGLSGTFLILSGLLLNCVPVAMLLRKPSFVIAKRNKDEMENEKEQITDEKLCSKTISIKCISKNNFCDLCPKSPSNTLNSKNSGNEKYCSCSPCRTNNIKQCQHQNEETDSHVKVGSKEDVCQHREYTSLHVPLNTQCYFQNCQSHNKQATPLRSKQHTSPKQNKTPPPRSRCNSNTQNIENKHAKSATSNNLLTSKQQNSSLECLVSSKKDVIYYNSCDVSPSNINFAYVDDNESSNGSGNLKRLPKDDQTQIEEPKNSFKNSLKVFIDPMFILITTSTALYGFTFVIIITVVVDFATDIGIEDWGAKYVLMAFSVGDFFGRIGLGWITDRGYMTKTGFAAMCFLLQGIAGTAIAWANGFYILLVVMIIYGVFEAGLIVIFPVIIAQYIADEHQTIAIPSSNFLSGPLYLAVSPLIGFFRESIGAYDGIFYIVGILSFICAVAWFFITAVHWKCFRAKKSSKKSYAS